MRFSRITLDYEIYRSKKVVLFGASSAGKKVKKYLDCIGDVDIVAILDNNEKKWGEEFDNLCIISPKEFIEKYREELNNIIIQICSEYEDEISKQLDGMNVDYIMYTEFTMITHQIREHNTYREDNEKQAVLDNRLNYIKWRVNSSLIENLEANNCEMDRQDIIVLFSPTKVGNSTFRKSLEARNRAFTLTWHNYKFIDERLQNKLCEKTIKLISGVRDPIAQNLSHLYQVRNMFWDLDSYWEKDGVQQIFDNYIISEKIDKNCYYHKYLDKNGYNLLVQDFFEKQFEKFFGIDIYQYPFDKEKGYNIYKFGNIEIFIYQLEKLNNLEKEIGNFLHIDDFKLIKWNDAGTKWYHPYYEETKRNIKLSKEYFEKVYSSKFIKHFYHEEDIEKFRKRWISQVKSE